MRITFSSIIVLMALSGATAVQNAQVSGRGQFGFALGGNNPDGSCKQASDYKADFDALLSYKNRVRTYATSGTCDGHP